MPAWLAVEDQDERRSCWQKYGVGQPRLSRAARRPIRASAWIATPRATSSAPARIRRRTTRRCSPDRHAGHDRRGRRQPPSCRSSACTSGLARSRSCEEVDLEVRAGEKAVDHRPVRFRQDDVAALHQLAGAPERRRDPDRRPTDRRKAVNGARRRDARSRNWPACGPASAWCSSASTCSRI